MVVLGLDGVPYGMVRRLVEEGMAPNLARLARRGTLTELRASVPEVSSVSWSCFMTGQNPAVHGIFGFTDLDGYRLRFPNFSDLRAPTLFDRLAERGGRSVVINLPATYPARPLRGVLVSGFVAVELRRAVYPPQLLGELEAMRYRVDLDVARARQDHDFLFRELKELLELRRRLAHRLWREPWDLFVLVITGTDRLHHFLFDAWVDPGHPRRQQFLEYWRALDGLLGEVGDWYEGLRGPKALVLLSDHGFSALEREVYLNAWLRREGWLRVGDDPQGPQDVRSGTRAFCLDPGRIYLHLRGRFPRGEVGRDEYDRLCEQLRGQLRELSWGGEPAFREVVHKEEVYRGPLLDRAPDLIVVPRPGLDPKGSFRPGEVFRESPLRGMHTPDAFLLHDLREPPPCAEISQVAGLVLRGLGMA